MAVIDALGLDKPVVMGCLIGGRIVLHLAFLELTRRASAPSSALSPAPTPSPTTISTGCTARMCTAGRCAAR